MLKLVVESALQRPIAKVFAIMSMATLLFLGGVSSLFYLHFSGVVSDIQSQQYLTAYFNSNLPSYREMEIISAVKKVPTVSGVEVVGRQTVIRNLEKHFPSLVNSLQEHIEGENQDLVPKYLKVRFGKKSSKELVKTLESIKGIESVDSFEAQFSSTVNFVQKLEKLAFLLLVLICSSIFFLAINHFANERVLLEKLQNTLRFMGAKASLVKLPLLVEAALEGLIAASLAGFLFIFTSRLIVKSGLSMSMGGAFGVSKFSIVLISGGMILVGMFTNVLGSLWVTRRN